MTELETALLDRISPEPNEGGKRRRARGTANVL